EVRVQGALRSLQVFFDQVLDDQGTSVCGNDQTFFVGHQLAQHADELTQRFTQDADTAGAFVELGERLDQVELLVVELEVRGVDQRVLHFVVEQVDHEVQ